MKLMHQFLLGLSVALTSVAALAEDSTQGLLLSMKVSRAGGEVMNPKLWSPVGATSSISNNQGMKIEVRSEAAPDNAVTLHIKVTESAAERSNSSGLTVTTPLGKDVRLQLGEDKAKALVLEFTPRLTMRPA